VEPKRTCCRVKRLNGKSLPALALVLTDRYMCRQHRITLVSFNVHTMIHLYIPTICTTSLPKPPFSNTTTSFDFSCACVHYVAGRCGSIVPIALAVSTPSAFLDFSGSWSICVECLVGVLERPNCLLEICPASPLIGALDCAA